ncbi:Putative type II secretion system protein K [Thalassocella blandensis]|nr:Putative type II secretion system protein K [Thalassocella blandensis]
MHSAKAKVAVKTPPLVEKQKGVALIMAMLIVVLVTAVAIEIRWRFELSISRSANRWAGVQAKAYLEGAEQLAMTILRQDLEDEETSKTDHLNEPWAMDAQPFPTDHGWVQGRLEDAQGRFNLNLMRPPDNQCSNGSNRENGICQNTSFGTCDKYSEAQLTFVRLLQTVNIAGPEDEEPVYLQTAMAEEIVEAIIDWLDNDSEISGYGGAESNYYEGLTPPTTIANLQMISVSELQQIKGVTAEIYRGLLPYVVALPTDNRQANGGEQGITNKINLNTAKAPLLRSIGVTEGCDMLPLPEETGQEIASAIAAGEYESMEDMEADSLIPPVWMNNNTLGIDKNLFGVFESSYFLFYGEVGIGDDYVRNGKSLIKRTKGQNGGADLQVVRRTDANF